MKRSSLLLCLLTFALNSLMSDEISVYISSNSPDAKEPLLLCTLDLETGSLTPVERYSGIVSPSYLCLSPDGKYLYSTLESGDGRIAAWSIDAASGKLQLIDIVSCNGSGPCHLSVTPDGRALLVTNYNSGQISVLPIDPDGQPGPVSQLITLSGSGPDKSRQESSHMHFIQAVPNSDLVLANDLGSDKIRIFRYNESQYLLLPNSDYPDFAIAPGSGPRHLVYHPTQPWLYLINELSATVNAIAYDPVSGAMELLGTTALLPANFDGYNKSAAIRIHPSGSFVYGSNRGDLNSLSIFRVAEHGELVSVGLQSEGIAWPRDFNIEPTGKFLLVANRATDEVRVFSINPQTGELGDTGQTVQIEKPVCVLFGDAL